MKQKNPKYDTLEIFAHKKENITPEIFPDFQIRENILAQKWLS